MKFGKKFLSLVMALTMLLSLAVSANAANKTIYKPGTYTVTANLYIDGKDNKILTNTTAYLTNTAFPPTSPVKDNATLTIKENGSMEITIENLNSIVRLQKVAGGKGAEVIGTTKGTASGSDYLKSLKIRLDNDSGSYSFSDSVEKPSVVNNTYNMPLQLSVDFSKIPKQASVKTGAPSSVEEKSDMTEAMETIPAPAVVNPAETKSNAVSERTSPIEKVSEILTGIMETVRNKIVSYFTSLFNRDDSNAVTQGTKVEEAAVAQEPVTDNAPVEEDTSAPAVKEENVEAVKHEETPVITVAAKCSVGKAESVRPGTYTVSANIWFTKGTTGLPMNPHITNSTFPPNNPVRNNAVLVIDKNGNGKVTVPITISSDIMSVKSISGLPIVSSAKSGGHLTSITVDLGKITNTSNAIRRNCTAAIEMGDLAMSISGMSKNHTWPATFQVNFSGLPSSGGGTLSAEAQEMLAASAMDKGEKDSGSTAGKHTISGKGSKAVKQTESDSHTAAWIGGGAGVLALAAITAWIGTRKR